MKRILPLLFCLLLALPITAQDDPESTPEPAPPPEPAHIVTIDAEDGVTLSGAVYLPHEGDAPVVLLLHELYATHASWQWQIAPLLANGYRVLAVDLRGYGATRGAISWSRAQTDTQAWLDWLYAQPGTQLERIFIMGSSMGANLALNGCADAAHCAGVVALSPGLNYFGVRTRDAIISGRHTLLVYADRDSIPRRDVPRMWALIEEAELSGMVSEIVYPGRAHGRLLFGEDETLMGQIIGWMNAR